MDDVNDDEEDVLDVVAGLLHKRKPTPPVPTRDLLGTGSTLLNLACSGRYQGGFPAGTYVFLVGDSSSGKTFLSLTCMAEAAANDRFKDHRFIFDNAENGALMDMDKFFGKKVAAKLEPPAGTKGNPTNSTTVEEFYYHLDDAHKRGDPFIYVLDSMDALGTAADNDKFDVARKAHAKGKDDDVAGSYGTSKAKANSNNLRNAVNRLAKTGSILIIISQTRESIGFAAKFTPKTRGGGKSLKFYAHLEIWSAVRSKIKKAVRGKDRVIGMLGLVEVVKNRITGWTGKVELPIYRSLGIDDTGSMVDFLIAEGHWKKKGGTVHAEEFEFQGTRELLIAKIENDDGELELKSVVAQVWKEIETGCRVQRKQRYE